MSLKKIHFVFVVHNHQPVGNFDHVIAEAVDRAYKPFIQTMADFPDIPFGLHITGPLWEWIEARRPSLWESIARMVNQGQVEMIGGGFYEPILPVLPDRDQIGQLQLMNAKIRDKFGVNPQGAWIAERVWEPQLPQPLAKAGLSYTFLDDTHFHAAGCKPDELDGLFLTDHAGHRLLLFPISQKMRYAVPFHPPEAALKEILSAAKEDKETLVCLADDGEKFGLWPGTYGTCYEEKWLERFFRLLREHKDQIEVLRPCDAASKLSPQGRVYLPSASYFEMTEWALPAAASQELTCIRKELEAEGRLERFKPFLKGGHWRNFFAKYEESARIYQRMLQVSEWIDNLAEGPLKIQGRRELYRAQCNCAYWHGIFGGLYLPHLRAALWERLIEAQRLCRWDSETPHKLRLADVDGDGVEEIRLTDDKLALTIRTEDGRIDDLEISRPLINLTDTLSRRPEAYHLDLAQAVQPDAPASDTIHSGLRVKEKHLENWLIYDPYPRRAAIE
ncbi:MAG: alpha-amylase/4-alpha-glucanotransferase domain-containing protein, partial [Calditrichota bacterium]